MPQASTSRLVRAAIIGASGRMGLALLHAAAQFPDLLITGAVVSSASPGIGQDAGRLAGAGLLNLPFSSDLPAALANADVAVDFSVAAATADNLEACRRAGKPLLLGTTGWPGSLATQFQAAAAQIPLLIAPNTSIGVTVLAELVRTAARALPAGFDIAVLETHHRGKLDAPSGTALTLRQAALEGRASAGGTAEVDIAAVRAGDIVGDHTVLLAGPGEQLALNHRATDRSIFAKGALRAALWLASRPPGSYTMRDFLGLKTVT